MKKLLSILLTTVFIVSIFPLFQPVKAAVGLVVTYSPVPLTAGCVPELVDPTSPLTIYVTDDNGEPYDLTLGGEVDNDAVWNILFKDSYPQELGQYNWVRTDLHNDDGTNVCNKALLGFQPIVIDFSQAKDGKYIFKGFCANDEGYFYITVYSPDRKRAGTVKINVEKPKVTYEIINTEDPDRNVFTVPGSPDFVLTGGDNRLYEITALAQNAQGLPIRGVDKDVNICGNIKEYARFTPFTTKLSNFDFTPGPETENGIYQLNGSDARFLLNNGGRYFLHLGIDLNTNGKIDYLNKEIFELGGFNLKDVDNLNNITETKYTTYYITSCVQWDDSSFVINPQFDFTPPDEGWGLGCIYNNGYDKGYLLPDLNYDGKLDYHDSLNFDKSGRCKFYIFSEDITTIGGIIGCNPYGDKDVAGGPPLTEDDPKSIERRYREDYTFFLDFDCVCSDQIGSGKPRIIGFDAKTGKELSTDLLNPRNYDLIYAYENHIKFQIIPSDYRDKNYKLEGIISLEGARHENSIYSRINTDSDDNGNNSYPYAEMLYTPTGVGEGIIWLNCYFENKNFSNPRQLRFDKVMYLDSVLGNGIEVMPEILYANEDNDVTITAKEIGTGRLVDNALIKASGCGINYNGKTDSNGKILTMFHPSATGEILVEVSKSGYISGTKNISVIKRQQKLFLDIDPFKSPTNKQLITITGRTLPITTIVIGDGSTISDNDGRFSIQTKLNEGFNQLIVIAKLENEEIKKSIEVVFDTKGPNILLDNIEKLIDRKDFIFKGRIDPGSTLLVNGIPAEIVHDLFEVKVTLNLGKNILKIEAYDELENSTIMTIEVYNYHEIKIVLTIGQSIANVDGKEIVLDSPPFIKKSRTFVPIRFISESFGAEVEWMNSTQSISIKYEDKTIMMQIGNISAFINGKEYLLDSPPEIRNGRTFIPLRFVIETFSAQIDWNNETQQVIIRKLV